MWSLGMGAVSWSVRKQKTVATSLCKAEYMVAYELMQECIWLWTLMNAIEREHMTAKPTTLFCDNKAAIVLSEDPTSHTRVKHFDIKYHFIQE